MIAAALNILLVLIFVAAAAYLLRIGRAPTGPERAISADGLSTCLACAAAVICARQNSPLHFDAVLFLALLGFLGSVALARYLERGRPLE